MIKINIKLLICTTVWFSFTFKNTFLDAIHDKCKNTLHIQFQHCCYVIFTITTTRTTKENFSQSLAFNNQYLH